MTVVPLMNLLVEDKDHGATIVCGRCTVAQSSSCGDMRMIVEIAPKP